jgi:hypothetical protein
VIFPYMCVMYLDHIHSLLFFPHTFKYNFSGFNYSIFIHTYNELQCYLPPQHIPSPSLFIFISFYLGLDLAYERKHTIFVFESG